MAKKRGATKASRKSGLKQASLTYGVPTKNQRATVGSPLKTKDISQTCALTDPFCEHARGAKLPDDDSTPSVAMQYKFAYDLAAGPGGVACCVIKPRPFDNVWCPGSTYSGTGVTTWGSFQQGPNVSTVTAAAGQYRIVSWGIRVFSQLAPTNQSGHIRFITSTEDVNTGAAFTTTGSFYEEISEYAVAGSNIHWVSKPVGIEWKEYIPISSLASYEQLVIYATGLPASSDAFRVEVTFNVELQPKPNEIAAALATAALVSKPHVLQAASHVHANRPKHYNGSTNSFSNILRGLAVRGLSTAANVMFPMASALLGNSVQKGAARLMGYNPQMIMDVD